MMTKQEFLSRLERALSSLPEAERRDILSDYEEHFAQGEREGLTDEEICRRLGDPETIAKEYAASSAFERADAQPSFRNVLAAIVKAVALGALNLFFVLPVFLALFCALVALMGIVLAVVIVTIVLLFFSLSLGTLFWNAGVLCLELLLFFGLAKLLTLLLRAVVSYLRSNVNSVRREFE